MAEVLMIKVDDSETDDGYSWACTNHSVKKKQEALGKTDGSFVPR